MQISEMFESVQGEGKYAGMPVFFIRVSGCTRKCSFCDSKYHTKGKKMRASDIGDTILKSGKNTVIWTGGEPTLQITDIKLVMNYLKKKNAIVMHHLETNGDRKIDYRLFDYVCFSPKVLNMASRIKHMMKEIDHKNYDIKVVTDLELNKKMFKHATMLMPLSTNDKKMDNKIEQDVWNYCNDNNIKFCLRQHVKVWGIRKRKV